MQRAIERFTTVHDVPCLHGHEAQCGTHETRLARARLANDRDRFPGADREINPAYRLQRPAVSLITNFRTRDLQNSVPVLSRESDRPIDAWRGGNQRRRMSVLWCREDISRHAFLNERATLKHHHPLAASGDDTEVVCNQQQRCVFA